MSSQADPSQAYKANSHQIKSNHTDSLYNNTNHAHTLDHNKGTSIYIRVCGYMHIRTTTERAPHLGSVGARHTLHAHASITPHCHSMVPPHHTQRHQKAIHTSVTHHITLPPHRDQPPPLRAPRLQNEHASPLPPPPQQQSRAARAPRHLSEPPPPRPRSPSPHPAAPHRA